MGQRGSGSFVDVEVNAPFEPGCEEAGRSVLPAFRIADPDGFRPLGGEHGVIARGAMVSGDAASSGLGFDCTSQRGQERRVSRLHPGTPMQPTSDELRLQQNLRDFS
jgi:hypothetical protein